MTWMPESPVVTDDAGDVSAAAVDRALSALREITPEHTIGEPAGSVESAEGVVSLRFRNTMPGYPGWFWTVSVTRLPGAEPSVLEVGLLPGDDALLAPEWVPWTVRLAEYRAHQDDTASESPDEGAALAGELADVADVDAAEFDEDGSEFLHAGDLDGVELDELDDGDEVDEAGEPDDGDEVDEAGEPDEGSARG